MNTMTKKVKHVGYQLGHEEYENGKTMLTPVVVKLLGEVSTIVYGFSDNYVNIHNSYSPQGIKAILIDQVILKVSQKEISSFDQKRALGLIEQLEKEMLELN